MHRNVGAADRLIRVAIGIVALLFVTRTPWAWLGLVPLLTGIAGWCPLYSVFGWSTRAVEKKA